MTAGIVGESGCGKTMTALSRLRLVPKPAGRIVSGEVWLNGEDLEEMRRIRGCQISMILQDPQSSLNPVFTIGNQLMEALGIARKEGRKSVMARAVEALRHVNVAAPERRLDDFPHQMSGGMKQRVVGAIVASIPDVPLRWTGAPRRLRRRRRWLPATGWPAICTDSEARQPRPGRSVRPCAPTIPDQDGESI
jgi:ABC-type dipeptide/oligopeptide/nickel transport system ATPase component